MILIYSDYHIHHDPPYELFNGNQEPHAEVPQRIERIYHALQREFTLETIPPSLISWNDIHTHDPAYIAFLSSIAEDQTTYTYPSVFRYAEHTERITHPVAKRGYFSFDTYTPISYYATQAAIVSASLAATGATLLLEGKHLAYALCRPPGHHAEYNRMGGYCYLNNAAVAANILQHHGTVAILDIDFHHGNGTQHIFYNNDKVLTISLHASPEEKFPFFSGFSSEKGQGKGEGYNKNYPLPLGITNKQYDQTLQKALTDIHEFNPNYLIIAMGYDTYEKDPIGGFRLTTPYYTEIANSLRSLRHPTLIVQEGGYNTEDLGNNAVAFVKGFIA